MDKIVFPLSSLMQGPTVGDLQDGLQLLLDRGDLLAPVEVTRQRFSDGFKTERRAQTYGSATGQLVRYFQEQQGLDASGAVDEPTADALNRLLDDTRQPDDTRQVEYSVSGRVAEPTGAGISELVVRAYDKCLGRENELGNASTDAEGQYSLTYQVEQLQNPERKQADLVVKVFSRANGVESVSPMIINALAQEVVNFVIGEEAYRGADLYQQVHEGLKEYLEGIALGEIEPRDIYCLANSTQLDVEHIHHYVLARQWEQGWKTLPAEFIFAWLRSGLPAEQGNVLNRSAAELKALIERSVEDNVISKSVLRQLGDLEAWLIERRAEYVITPGDRSVSRASLGQLLQATALSEAQSRELLRDWQTFEGDAADFWVAQGERLGVETSRDLELTLQLGALTRNHLPLIAALKQGGRIRQFGDVAQLTQEDWLRLFEESALEMPSDLLGDDEMSQRQAYAGALTQLTESLLPTRVLAEAFRRDTTFDSEHLDRFFEQHETFDFRQQSIRSYLADVPDALADFSDPPAVQLELEALQRIFHISPTNNRPTVAKVLWSNQLHSAWAITMLGEEALSELFPGEPMMAKRVHKQAHAIQQVSQAAFFQHFDHQFSISPGFFPTRNPGTSLPDLESLFGGQGYCECKHCLSFFSPSAYLVDLFLFLKKAGLKQTGAPADENTVLESLFKRRPDLGNLKLDCDNAMTPLPYIDLVNEILENAIDPRSYVATPSKILNQTFILPVATDAEPVPQTAAEAEVLKAFPQHLNPSAYQTLHEGEGAQGIYYPWNLPFNLWAEEVRVYLNHLDVPRWQLMETAFGQSIDSTDIACEYLGIIPGEKAILVDANPSSNMLDQYWGISDAPGSLAEVDVFLKQSEYSYDQLRQLLDLRYVQGADTNPLRIRFEPESSCKVTDARLENLTEIALSRIHRLARLDRKIGNNLIRIDQCLMAFGSEINADFLEDYAELQRIQGMLRRKLKYPEILSWWHTLDTHDYPDQSSLYRKLFLNTAVSQPVEALFMLNDSKTELINAAQNQATTVDLANPDLSPDLTAHLMAALQWSMPELRSVVRDQWENASFDLTLANLSFLFRVASFCRALRLSVSEYLTFKALVGVAPLPDPDNTGTIRPRASRAFIEIYQRVTEVGLDPSLLNYLLRHQQHPDATFALSEGEVASILQNLQVVINKLLNESEPEGISVAERAQLKLSLILAPEEIATLRLIVEQGAEATLSVTEQHDFIDEKLYFLPDPVEAKDTLVGSALAINERYAYLLEHLEPYLIENAVVQQLARALGMTVDLSDSLLGTYLRRPSDPTAAAISVFFAQDFLNPVEEALFNVTYHPEQVKTVLRLQKISLLESKLALDSGSIKVIMKLGSDAGLPDLATISVVPSSGEVPPSEFSRWQQLAELVAIDRAHFQNTTSLFDVLDSVHDSIADLLGQLSSATGWDTDDLAYLAGASGLDLEFPSDFKSGTWLVRMAEILPLLMRIGASAQKVAGWISPDVTRELAQSVRLAVKAKYGNDRWLEVTAPLRDELREQQRDALLGYVLHHKRKHDQRRFMDVDDLYGYFLMDPQMSACATTSRTVLANSSVQLLVQRILMNLETGMTFSRNQAEEWKWRKNYRIWEANRKVLLWPENWIEPELRDDKSPFFRELENELLQNEISAENVERVFENYLYKLDEVARLEICAVHYEDENRTLHVFGRTAGTPSTYYYRRWENRQTWTAWEKLELDINNAEGIDEVQTGVTLLPVAHNRRLYLFWPIFSTKLNDPDNNEKVEGLEMWKGGLEAVIEQKESYILETEKEIKELKETIEEWENFPGADGTFTNEVIQHIAQLKAQLEEAQTRLKQLKIELENLPKEVEATEDLIGEAESVPGTNYYSVRMAWSEYRQGRWSARKTTSESVRTPNFEGTYAKQRKDIHRYFFVPTELTPGELLINWFYNRNLGVWLLNSWFTFDSCKNELVAAQIFPADYVKQNKKLDDYIWHMKAKENATGPSIKLRLRTSATETDLLLKKTPKNHLLSCSLSQGYRIQTTPLVYEDRRRSFLVIPPLPKSLLFPPEALPTHAFAGKVEVLQHLAFRKATKRGQEPQSVSESVQIIGSDSFSEKYFQPGESRAVLVRPERGAALGATPSIVGAKISRSKLNRDIISGSISAITSGVPTKIKLRPLGPYVFRAFYHPYVCLFLKQLNRFGVEGLLNPIPSTPDGRALGRQATPDHKKAFDFSKEYGPNSSEVNHHKYPEEIISFDYEDPYASYNWELFFHVPLMIATRLQQDQRFETAQQWFHYIFNPTETEGTAPYRFWKIKPFHEYTQEQMEADSEMLVKGEEKPLIQAWQRDPFNPHLLARFRRLAYMKTTVMKYLDNLIAWGDQLFRRDSIESLNEATQLYVLAGQILGKLPVAVESRKPQAATFVELSAQLNELGNVWVEIENQQQGFVDDDDAEGSPAFGGGDTPFFCFPPNEKLLAYWDTVADRLFKVRHCMNIEGLVRQLPLFQPPIDPALLVKAAAAGVDLSSALNDLYAPLPHYRFAVMVQNAQAVCQELKALGGALLSALEKKDSEEIAFIRSSQEIDVLKLSKKIRTLQIEETRQVLDGIKRSKEVVETRRDYYESIVRVNANEQLHMDKLGDANTFNELAQFMSVEASFAAASPNIDVGTTPGGTSGTPGPVVKASFGGSNVTAGLQAAAGVYSFIAARHTYDASMASIKGGYDRRWDEWQQQEKVANKELAQIDKQIVGAEIRLEIAQQELTNHELQIENASKIADFLRRKYTNQELYGWMVGQLTTVYFQTYQLAYDISKKAEKTFAYELGLESSSYVQFGYWDNLRKGLLAGEKLSLDLKRLELAYMEKNRREYELTRHVSLRRLDPVALLQLKATGTCHVNLPEWLFDMEDPGHYMRRLKNLSLSIPAVAGPYTGVNCTLSLISSTVRRSPLLKDGIYERTEEDDRFVEYFGTVQSIVTSHAQNDSGLFETNLRDERYLPFEGQGVVSSWKLELPDDFRQFDYNTISDVVMHLRYTARQGGASLAQEAIAYLRDLVMEAATSKMVQMFSLRHEFPSEWQRFVAGSENFNATIKKTYFPYLVQSEDITISAVELYVIEDGVLESGIPEEFDAGVVTTALSDNNEFELSLAEGELLKRDKASAVFLVVHYAINLPNN